MGVWSSSETGQVEEREGRQENRKPGCLSLMMGRARRVKERVRRRVSSLDNSMPRPPGTGTCCGLGWRWGSVRSCNWGTRFFVRVNICSEINAGTCRWDNVTPFCTNSAEGRRTAVHSASELQPRRPSSTLGERVKSQRRENRTPGLKEVSQRPSVQSHQIAKSVTCT